MNYFTSTNIFDNQEPIKVIDTRKTLLGIGFLNEEKTKINPKLVLNAKWFYKKYLLKGFILTPL